MFATEFEVAGMKVITSRSDVLILCKKIGDCLLELDSARNFRHMREHKVESLFFCAKQSLFRSSRHLIRMPPEC